MPLSALFDGGMTWGEAWNLTRELLADTSSHVFAAVNGWTHPVAREALVLADVYDLLARAHTTKGKPKPYPRPWDERPKRLGRATRPQRQIRAALAARGHH